MTDRVYVTAKLERQLEQMARQTNAPAVAAQRARQIIDSLIGGYAPIPGFSEGTGPDGPWGSDGSDGADGPDPVGAGLLRYKKDKRVKNCLKFNLGKGYRLICIKEKKEIFVMFMGDHDSCDAWLIILHGNGPIRQICPWRSFPWRLAPMTPGIPESVLPGPGCPKKSSNLICCQRRFPRKCSEKFSEGCAPRADPIVKIIHSGQRPLSHSALFCRSFRPVFWSLLCLGITINRQTEDTYGKKDA